MAANMQKIKLLKLYELLRKETDESHPISRVELCRRLNEMGISSNVRTLSLDIEVMQDNGFEIMSYLKDKEKFYYVPEHELTVPEIKILIDAVQAASFVTEKKTAELVEKVAALGGSHQAELLKENMVCFNTRKHTNVSCSYPIVTENWRGGGVRAMDGWYLSRRYLHDDQEALLRSLLPGLQPEQQETMKSILSAFAKPSKETNN